MGIGGVVKPSVLNAVTAPSCPLEGIVTEAGV
jgi:hypothetical protein